MEQFPGGTNEAAAGQSAPRPRLSEFERGLLAGLLLVQGSWTGDRRAGWLAVKVAADDPEPIALLQHLLGGHRYGPYQHGGRHYRLWRLQSRALFAALPLVDELLPASRQRDQYLAWKDRYGYAPPYTRFGRRDPAQQPDLAALIAAAQSSNREPRAPDLRRVE